MRTDLKVNYDDLRDVRDKLTKYINALEDMEDSLKDLKNFLKKQKSDSITKLQKKIKKADVSIKDKKETAKELKKILSSYISDMTVLVNAKNSGSMTRVDYLDISWNIQQIEGDIGSLRCTINNPIQSSSSYGFGNYKKYLDSDDEAERKRALRQQAEEEKQKRNYDKLEGARTGILTNGLRCIEDCLDNINRIYKKYIRPLETVDDKYRTKLSGIYDRRTSDKDKITNWLKDFGNIAGAFLEKVVPIILITVACVLCPEVGAVLLLSSLAESALLVTLTLLPEEYTPNWLKGAREAGEGISNTLVTMLTDPTEFVANIGQDFMDTIQTPEGIASVSGEAVGIAASVAIAWKPEKFGLEPGKYSLKKNEFGNFENVENIHERVENAGDFQKVRDPKYLNEAGRVDWEQAPNNGAVPGTIKPNQTLKKGTIIDRYGSPKGDYTSPAGTPFDMRSLPYEETPSAYHRYEVIKDIEGVTKSEIAPAFDMPGGGTQYQMPEKIEWLKRHKYIREIK